MNILNRLGLGSSGQTNMDPSPIAQGNDDDTPAPGNQFAQFGAGCFWGVELAFQRVPGVTQTEAGYTQGTVDNPSYGDVCSGTTGHSEVVRVQYDLNDCTYESLLDLFWSRHDPTTLNRQVFLDPRVESFNLSSSGIEKDSVFRIIESIGMCLSLLCFGDFLIFLKSDSFLIFITSLYFETF